MKDIKNLEHLYRFSSGKHGVVGKCKIDDESYVYKISKYLNFTADHEHQVMESLGKMKNYSIHFPHPVGVFEKNIDINFKKAENPFRETTNMFPAQVCIMEDLEDSVKFSNFIRNPDVPDEIIFSQLKQLLLAILFAQKDCDFSHYDLHSSNVLIKKCPFDTVHVYKLDEENIFSVPTYGYYPVIIDFGFSHVKELDNGDILSPLDYSNIGYTTNLFDSIADAKVLMVSMAYEVSERRPDGKYTKVFDNIVKNLFHELRIEWDCGWDKYDKLTAIDKISKTLVDYTSTSDLFSNVEFFCYDLAQYMIEYPLQPKDVSDLKKSFKMFIKEFNKLESDFSNNFYRLYLMKSIVISAKQIKERYRKGTERAECIRLFKNVIFDEVRKVKKFYTPECNFEKLLCGLIVFSDCLEGCLYKETQKRKDFKEHEYAKLDIQKMEHIWGIVDFNIQLPYKFRKYSNIVVFDRPNDITQTINIDDTNHINLLNSIDKIGIGMVINKIINKDEEYIKSISIETTELQTPVIDSFDEQELSSSSEEQDSETDEEYSYSKDYN